MRQQLLHLLLIGAVTVAADAAATASAKACVVSPLKTLTWNCGGRCAAKASCIAYASNEVSPCNSSNESGDSSPWRTCAYNASSSCDIQCFKVVEPDEFQFFVAFNDSQATTAPPATGPPESDDDTTGAFPAREEDVPFESNEFVRRIDVLGVLSTTTTVKIVGSRSGDMAARGNVVDLEISPKIFSKAPQLTDIRLININLGDRPLDVTTLVPRSVKWLHLRNTKLTKFPEPIRLLKNLTSLALDNNYFTEFPSTLALPSLSDLKLAGNDLTAFNVTGLKSLQYLDLSENKLSLFPYDTLMRSPKLQSVTISNNPFTKKVLFSTAQFVKVSKWTTFEIETAALDNSSCSASQVQELPASSRQSVCVVSAEEWTRFQSTASLTIVIEPETNRTTDPGAASLGSEPISSPGLETSPVNSSSTDAVVVQGILGAVIGFVLVVAAAVVFILWKKRRSKTDDSLSATDVASSRGTEHDPTDADIDELDPQPSDKRVGASAAGSEHKMDLQSIRVASSDLRDVRVIGSGSSASVVWLVQFRKNRQLASKRLIATQHDNSEAQKARRAAFLREIQIASSLTYPTIVSFVGVAWTNESDLQALFEYMPGGTLQSLLAETTPETMAWKDQKIRVVVDVIKALVYTHSFSPVVLHRDLRARNVLLTEDGKAKLSNFSDARQASEDATMTTSGVGSGRWLAPEILLGSSSYEAPSDIYAFGVLLSEIDSHQLPYSDVVDADGNPVPESALLQRVAKDALRPTVSSECPSEISALAAQCLAADPASRPTAMGVEFTLRKLVRSYEAANTVAV